LGAKLYSIERQEALYKKTQKLNSMIAELLPDVYFSFGDGFEGLPEFAPFDKIIITAAAPKVPEKLWEQLKVKGIMVIPLDESENAQRMLRLTKKKDGLAKRESFEQFSFVPMLQGKSQS
jgi:protein-L-isoaspartate(D-aspartate) O-methyltransferase